jgi:uncharacterized protein (DUF1778 family)
VSGFVTTATRQAAQPTGAETQVIHLALADQRALAAAVADPPQPAPALRRAREAHRGLIIETR